MAKIILKYSDIFNIIMHLFLIIAIGLCATPLICSGNEVDEIIVNIKQGTLRGKQQTGVTGDKYYSFKGIPYAKPPLGTLRFKAPQPPESWTGVRDATVHRSRCIQQLNFILENESEDCLYINVYTPEDPNYSANKLKPVMFWTHGGGFETGSGNSDMFGPDYLVQENIILVTYNYRLGIFGFLRVDDPTIGIPGNAAMKDMVMALKWTKDNILNFGGDPDNITIAGLSAGGAATHLLTLSPLTRGLFQRAIIESGTGLAMWSTVLPEINPVHEIAKSLNVAHKSERQIVEELYLLSAEEVIGVQKQVNYIPGNPMIFGPTVEKLSNEAAFILDHPLNIIRSGNYNKVPTIFGYVSREGMLFKTSGLNFLTRDIEDFIPFDWRIPKGSPKSKELAEQIAKFYYNGEKPTEDNVDITYVLLTDTHFINSMFQSMREQLKVSNEEIYLYRFSVDGRNNVMKKIYNIALPGVCHGDNNLYRFMDTTVSLEVMPNSVEDLTIKRFVKLCANFVKYGNPTLGEKSDLINIKWDPISEEEFTFLDLGENLSVGVNPDLHRQSFWDELRQSIEN
ncbi:juvenile hormone esterase-like [Agrilus planipennis]|uniref:Carboxylic ester hydrolase n=1 Tax=Agrilus planipennis TaxID=224129 RepID=A0A7F5R6Y7_AGRPL|nr:juvenile hormone esterase-like [Agrilus planipennis]